MLFVSFVYILIGTEDWTFGNDIINSREIQSTIDIFHIEENLKSMHLASSLKLLNWKIL
jgi:hypothetical protein